jgi:co-chaperonin GroES (HSP10)
MQQLIGKRVLIEPEDPRVTESGIILEHVVKNWEEARPEYGTILYVGSGVESDLLKPGVRIHINKMGAKKFPYEGKDLVLVREDDITGVFIKD